MIVLMVGMMTLMIGGIIWGVVAGRVRWIHKDRAREAGRTARRM